MFLFVFHRFQSDERQLWAGGAFGQRDDGIQQRSLADYKKINEEHFDLQHISSIFTEVFVVSLDFDVSHLFRLLQSFSSFAFLIPSCFCIYCSHMLFVNCFIYYITEMLDGLEQITHVYSTVVAKI